MKTQTSITFKPAPCVDGSDLTVFAHGGGTIDSLCIAIYTGDASVYLRPTNSEARALVAALQSALDARAAAAVTA